MKQLQKIYQILSDKSYHSATDIGKQLGISDRNVREKMNTLRTLLSNTPITLLATPRKGYCLQGNLINQDLIFNSSQYYSLNNTENRQAKLLCLLLGANDFIKLEQLGKEIFVTPKSVSSYISNIENKIKKYNLTLIRKPHYGIKISGSEFQLRNIMIDLVISDLPLRRFDEFLFTEPDSSPIYLFLVNNHIKISDWCFSHFISTILVCLKRTQSNKNLSFIPINKDQLFEEKYQLIKTLCNNFFPDNNLTNDDFDFITLKFLSLEETKYTNIPKNEQVDNLVTEIFHYLKIAYPMSFNKSEKLYQNLYTHLASLLIRLRYHIPIDNPLLQEIKENKPLEFGAARFVANIIEHHYQETLSDAEIGYLAVILSISKEDQGNTKNILIVCPAGRSLSKFLAYQYEQIFDNVNVNYCSVAELLNYDLSNIDVVFSLVDIENILKKPVYKVNYFLNDSEILRIKNIIYSSFNWKKTIPKELFFSFDEAVSKDEIIDIVCNKLKYFDNVPQDITQKIKEREQLGMTQISPDIAIPHLMTPLKNVNLLAAVRLKHPIIWSDTKVTLIFFLLLNNQENNNDPIFKLLGEFTNNKEMIDIISNLDNYEDFIRSLEVFEKI